jgi:hypothetical protein
MWWKKEVWIFVSQGYSLPSPLGSIGEFAGEDLAASVWLPEFEERENLAGAWVVGKCDDVKMKETVIIYSLQC